jgi:mannose-1-phosphate guanylyltransferase/mannose-6-phosphate isomerase
MTDQYAAGATVTGSVPGDDLEHEGRAALPAHSVDEYVLGDRNPTDDIFVAERPWGEFQQFVSNEQVTVKIITVQPGHRLSLQRHDHRGEMWQVLDVPIDITVDDREWVARRGETIWVPRGSTHRMGNSGSRPGRLLEVAFGHFDETDIQRLQDDYAR